MVVIFHKQVLYLRLVLVRLEVGVRLELVEVLEQQGELRLECHDDHSYQTLLL